MSETAHEAIADGIGRRAAAPVFDLRNEIGVAGLIHPTAKTLQKKILPALQNQSTIVERNGEEVLLVEMRFGQKRVSDLPCAGAMSISTEAELL